MKNSQNMPVHQCANFELNLSRNSSVISADMHACLPLSNQSVFLLYIPIFLLI